MKLKEFCTERGTIKALAEEIGISASWLCKCIRDERIPDNHVDALVKATKGKCTYEEITGKCRNLIPEFTISDFELYETFGEEYYKYKVYKNGKMILTSIKKGNYEQVKQQAIKELEEHVSREMEYLGVKWDKVIMSKVVNSGGL